MWLLIAISMVHMLVVEDHCKFNNNLKGSGRTDFQSKMTFNGQFDLIRM
jgi:hypothetical protein